MTATRKSRFSLSAKIASILACVAILSVGFASWWIVNLPETTKTSSGSFEVYTVETKNITYGNVTIAPDGGKIVFGAPKDATAGTYKWLGYDTSAVADEELTATITVPITLTNEDGSPLTGENLSAYLEKVDVNVDLGAYASVDSDYVKAAAIKYQINDGAVNTATGNTFSLGAAELAGDDITLKITIEFGWGDLTNNQNPYTYFGTVAATANNAHNNSITNMKAAQDMLGTVANLTDATYTVTVTAVQK